MERGNETTGRVKVHRRLSSVFIPPQPPILERTATLVNNVVTPVSTKFRLRAGTLSNEREVIPNCLAERGVHRYQLHNYRHYCGNKITTAKYTLLTFIPKNLWEQFHRIANLYFVIIACLNWIPALQAFNRYVGMIPVGLILLLTACKDAYEDFRRRRLDKQINCSYCHVWDSDKNRFRKMQWRHVIVGDFVHLSIDEVIPADILLIRSSDTSGICFVETSNLDGETSLKQRRVPTSIISFSGEESEFKPPQFKATIVCEKPNNLVYQMKGRIMYGDGHIEGIYRENMLLRGCKIRNTTFVEGIVLYAGKDTKVMMNNSGVRYKRSSLELATNRFILYCVAILIAMCLFNGIASMLWLFSFAPDITAVIFIILNTKSPITEGIINLVSSILNYQILIPLSLYISVELIKLGQIYLISADIDLYYEKSDRRMECRSLNIPEELGQIQYVLSDKTGTLTENKMIFRRCAIGGIDFGLDIDYNISSNDLSVENVVTSPTLKRQVDMEWNSNPELLDFFLTMAICNTVVVNKIPHVDAIDLGFFENGVFTTGNSTFLYSLQDPNYPLYSITSRFKDIGDERLLSGQRKRRGKFEEKMESLSPLYEAESPDELALVYAARAYGISLLSRSAESVTVALPYGNKEAFEILKVLPFDSTRKRMSIIVRREDEVVIYCKGADSEVISVLARSFVDSTYGTSVLRDSRALLEKFSTQGLRTLCLAKRTITIAEYEAWIAKHLEIENNINSVDRDDDLAKSINEIERDFSLLGVTAIEDRLQEGVEETIDVLRQAGIQMWLLTGDKMETAINVARSCGLFPSNCSIYVIDTESDVQTTYVQTSQNPFNEIYCIVLSSTSLHLLAQNHELLLGIITRSLAVLCYRMTPSNKAEIVKIVKKTLKGKVLAIGDGANDVPMIQCADVGIGISGQEGMQAVMAADFAIARFRYLHKLLLVHGHWCYDRLAKTFLYFLYKNALFVFVIFWCQMFNGFSGGAPMDQIYMMTYPIIFTSVQPLIFGIYDQVAHRKILYEKPKLYTVGRKGKVSHIYRCKTYWDSTIDYHTFGFLLATSIFIVNTIHLVIEVHCWTAPMIVIFLFFILVHFVYFRIEELLVSPSWQLKDPPVDVSHYAMITPEFWSALLLSTVIAVTPRFFVHMFFNAIRPSEVFVESLLQQKKCKRCRVLCINS
uniref:Phospholipid-transporting ATPase n=1 Tax=Ascaris lumbricoides TaxID=6252 RepID=A0A9J2PPK4_ASCLU